MTKELNIYEKLYEVRRKANYLQKDSKGHTYSYVNETSVLGLIRPLLDEYRLLFEVDMSEPNIVYEPIPITGSKKTHIPGVLQAKLNFTFVNVDKPSERVEKSLFLQDECGDPKKLGGLLTYGVRFFLVKYFNIPTDEMDPDSFQNKETGKLTDKQIAILKGKLLKRAALREKVMSWAQVTALEDITPEQYETAIKSIDNHIKQEQKAVADAQN